MKGGLAIGLLAGTFLGLAIGFVTFSGDPGAEALDVDLGVDAVRAATAEAETPRAPASASPLPAAPAAEERAASVAPLERERSVSSLSHVGDGVIEGTVTDEDGAPVAGVVLRARKASERNLSDEDDVGHVPVDKSLEEVLEEAAEEWNEERASRRETTTDADGRYRFDELVDGKYGLSAHAAGFQIEPRSGSSWSIRPNSTVNWKALPVVELPVTVTLPGGGAIEKVGLRRTLDRRGGRSATDLLWRRDRRTLKVAPGTLTLKAFVDEPLSRKLGLPEMVSDEETVDVLSDRPPDPVVLELRR
ncbi:MAG: carboxypeptidase-like regulatory domain-containing protein, partial [Planctomycetota bacterium JB042]